MDTAEAAFAAMAERALAFVPEGGAIGLGSGRAASSFIRALGKRVGQGFQIRGVATSKASQTLADELHIPLTTLADVDALDVAIDGADEVDPQGNLIKGLGGALVREKIVATSARKFVILVGEEKLVPVLGTHGILPVEVVPFGVSLCSRKLRNWNLTSQLRSVEGKPFESDNGNCILDVKVGPLQHPADVERLIRDIPGVVGTGLFLGMSPTVLIQRGNAVEVLEPAKAT